MKREYVNPKFNIIEIEPVELLAGSGSNGRSAKIDIGTLDSDEKGDDEGKIWGD